MQPLVTMMLRVDEAASPERLGQMQAADSVAAAAAPGPPWPAWTVGLLPAAGHAAVATAPTAPAAPQLEHPAPHTHHQ